MLKRVVLLLVLVVGGANVGGAEDAAEAIVADPPVGDSDGIVFLPVTPRGSIDIDGTTFDVEPFYIAKYETTNAQYAAFVQAADGFDDPAWWNDMPAEYSPPQRGLSAPRNGLPNAPRETVSWYQAVAFTRWLNARMAAKNAAISTGGLLVNGVELNQVDDVHIEVGKAFCDLLLDVIAGSLDALGGHEQLIAVALLEGESEAALAVFVAAGHIEVGDAPVDGVVDDLNSLSVLVGEIPADAPQSEGSDFDSGASQCALWNGHVRILP